MRRLPLFLILVLLASLAHAGVTRIIDSKQPWEEIPGAVDFSSRLAANDNVHADNCIVTGYDPAGVVVTDNIVSYDNTATDNTVPYTRKGGSDGNTYKITVRCTSVGGAKLEQDVIFKVQEY